MVHQRPVTSTLLWVGREQHKGSPQEKTAHWCTDKIDQDEAECGNSTLYYNYDRNIGWPIKT